MNHNDNCAPCASGEHATIEPDQNGIERCTCCGEAESGRYLPGTYPWATKTSIDLWNDLCAAIGDDDDQNAVLGILAIRLGIDEGDE